MTMKLSKINMGRLQRFKANRRAIWSFWIFSFIFIFTLFAEVVSNERPLIVKYNTEYYFPIFVEYTETEFGGEFETAADFSDPYILDLINEKGWHVNTLIPYSNDTIIYDLPSPAPSPPTSSNWLGTDDKGRDVVARLIYGFRISVLFGIYLTIFGSIIGIAVGAIQGYYGGKVDLFGQRLLEVWSSMPTLFLLIILSSVIEPNFWWLLGITLLFSWMGLVGVVRAEFLRTRNYEYVMAARALGLSDIRIMYRHILPNAMVASMTFLPFILGGAITTLTSLDFLGFGLPTGSPSLGELLAQGKTNMHAPWLGISSFIVLGGMFSLLVFIGEGVRDAFDPRKSY
jgi:microcin C transport system permease protein